MEEVVEEVGSIRRVVYPSSIFITAGNSPFIRRSVSVGGNEGSKLRYT